MSILFMGPRADVTKLLSVTSSVARSLKREKTTVQLSERIQHETKSGRKRGRKSRGSGNSCRPAGHAKIQPELDEGHSREHSPAFAS